MKTIKLDGSYGAGIMSTLSITTRAREEESGTKSETFRIPFGLICFDQLIEQVKYGFILGYSVQKDIDYELEAMLNNVAEDGGL